MRLGIHRQVGQLAKSEAASSATSPNEKLEWLEARRAERQCCRQPRGYQHLDIDAENGNMENDEPMKHG